MDPGEPPQKSEGTAEDAGEDGPRLVVRGGFNRLTLECSGSLHALDLLMAESVHDLIVREPVERPRRRVLRGRPLSMPLIQGGSLWTKPSQNKKTKSFGKLGRTLSAVEPDRSVAFGLAGPNALPKGALTIASKVRMMRILLVCQSCRINVRAKAV